MTWVEWGLIGYAILASTAAAIVVLKGASS